jgi:hypothetical protein
MRKTLLTLATSLYLASPLQAQEKVEPESYIFQGKIGNEKIEFTKNNANGPFSLYRAEKWS